MNERVQIINPLEYDSWDETIRLLPNYSFFHSLSWAKVLHDSYQYTPKYFSLIDRQNEVLGIIPFMDVDSILTGHRGVALPFTDYCEPMVTSQSHFDKLLAEGIEYGRKAGWKFMDIRGGNYFGKDIPYSEFFYRHTLDLSNNESDLFSGFSRGTKSCTNKGIKEGVEVAVDNSPEGMKAFYRLNCMTRKKHGLPPQPYRFFEMIYKYVISRNLGLVFLASYKKEHVAAAIFFHFGDKAIYKYGASDQAFLHLRPNNVIFWEAIKWYSGNGYRNLCFGRTEPMNHGLRNFKSGWGTTEEVVHYYRYDIRNSMFLTHHPGEKTWHTNVMRKMPITLLKMAGALLYRHMG